MAEYDDSNLPSDWNENFIPTSHDLYSAAQLRLNSQDSKLENQPHPPSNEILEAIHQAIRTLSIFQKILPDVVNLGLRTKTVMLEAGRIDLWRSILVMLFHSVNEANISETLSQTLKYEIQLELGRIALTNANFERTLSSLDYALQHNLKNHDPEQKWLVAYATYLEATYAGRNLHQIRKEALHIIKLAKQSKNAYAEMVAYMMLSRAYNKASDHYHAFIYAQQTLALAKSLDSKIDMLMALTNMTRYILDEPHLEAYLQQILTFWETEGSHQYHLLIKGHYHGQLAPIYYRQKYYRKAIKSYARAYLAFHRLEDQANKAYSLHGLGMALVQDGNYSEMTEILFTQAMELYEMFGMTLAAAQILHCLAWLFQKRGDEAQEEKFMNLALEKALSAPEGVGRERTLACVKKDMKR